MAANAVPAVKLSLGRSLHRGDVFATFYELFLQCDPRIPGMFANTDWEEQKRLLRQGVNHVIGFYEGSPTAENALGRVRHTHGRERLNIPPDLYPCWVESMIEAVRAFDPEMDAQLEQKWRSVLQNGTAYLKAGFEE